MSELSALAACVRTYFVFVTGGGVGALTNWIISFVLTSLIGIHYLISFTCAQAVNVTVNFIWHRFITFDVRDNAGRRFFRFFFMSIATMLISVTLVWIVKEYVLDAVYTINLFGLELNYLAAIIAITFAVSIANFSISRAWVFGENHTRSKN